MLQAENFMNIDVSLIRYWLIPRHRVLCSRRLPSAASSRGLIGRRSGVQGVRLRHAGRSAERSAASERSAMRSCISLRMSQLLELYASSDQAATTAAFSPKGRVGPLS